MPEGDGGALSTLNGLKLPRGSSSYVDGGQCWSIVFLVATEATGLDATYDVPPYPQKKHQTWRLSVM